MSTLQCKRCTGQDHSTSVTCKLLWMKTRARASWLLLFRYSVTGPDSAPLLSDAAILLWSFFLAVCVRA